MTDMTINPTTTDTTERRVPWAAAPVAILLSAAGLLALVIGLLTPWVDVTVAQVAGAEELQAAIDVAIEEEYGSANPSGITLDDGALVVVFSVTFAALLGLHLKRGRQGKGLPRAAVVIAAILALIGFGNIADIDETNEQLQLLLPVSIDISVGLYLTVVGAVLAMAGAIVASLQAEPKAATAVDIDSVA